MATNHGQIIALTTDDKLAMLRRAWQLAPADANSLLETIRSQLSDAQDRADDDVNSSASNSHSASSNLPGSNRITDQENVRGWNAIIEAYVRVREYLLNCCKYGLDAFATQCAGVFPTPLPAKIADPTQRLLIDLSDQWEILCDREGIDVGAVIGKVVGDESIYLWLLTNWNLLNTTRTTSESRGDYSAGIVGRGGAGF